MLISVRLPKTNNNKNIMKKFLSLILFALLCQLLPATAQNVLWVDYCGGQYDSRQRAVAEAGNVEVAIRLTADQLSNLGGNEVSQLAMAFPTTHPTTMKMWIRDNRNGDNLREIDITSTNIKSKWNTYTLDNPLPLTGAEKELWVGASWEQKYASNKYLSMAGPTVEDGCYYRVDGGDWQNMASSEFGSLCIRMGVTGDNIPVHDMSLSRVSTDELSYGIGEKIPFKGRITNHGVDDVVNPIIRCSINGNVVADVPVTATVACGEYADVTFDVPTDNVTSAGIAAFTFEALWADGEADTRPENNTAGVNVGLVVADRDMILENVRPASALVKLGSNITVTGTIRNNNYVKVVNPQIGYSINGSDVVKKSISCTLKVGESFDFSFTIPTKTITEPCEANVDLELLWRDGGVDKNVDDNKAGFKVTLTNDAPNRRMVVEEGTGTWCGWCVRGIVGLHDMAAKYGDRFIGIAVHTGDGMQQPAYSSFLVGLGINGYPGSIINRQQGAVDPSFGNLEKAFKAMPEYSEIDVDVDADLNSDAFTMTAHITPLVDVSDKDYRVAFVVTEDHISGKQSNYYAGGGYGTMGGFEKLPSTTEVDFMDVARGIWPSTTGSAETALPATMTAGTTYSVEHKINASSAKVANIDNCNVIAIVLDNATGLVVNAGRFEQRLLGIDSVLAPTATTESYNLAGQRVNASTKGIRIEGGKKIIR